MYYIYGAKNVFNQTLLEQYINEEFDIGIARSQSLHSHHTLTRWAIRFMDSIMNHNLYSSGVLETPAVIFSTYVSVTLFSYRSAYRISHSQGQTYQALATSASVAVKSLLELEKIRPYFLTSCFPSSLPTSRHLQFLLSMRSPSTRSDTRLSSALQVAYNPLKKSSNSISCG